MPAWLEASFGRTATISSIRIRECAGRIRRCELLYMTEDGWEPLYRAGQICQDWQVTFPPVTTRQIRLDIKETADAPTIWEIQVFDDAGCSVMGNN